MSSRILPHTPWVIVELIHIKCLKQCLAEVFSARKERGRKRVARNLRELSPVTQITTKSCPFSPNYLGACIPLPSGSWTHHASSCYTTLAKACGLVFLPGMLLPTHLLSLCNPSSSLDLSSGVDPSWEKLVGSPPSGPQSFIIGKCPSTNLCLQSYLWWFS